jgi:hypothetical protein
MYFYDILSLCFRGGIGEWAVRGPMFFFEVGEVKGGRMRIEVG